MFMFAAAATRGDIMVKNVIPKHLEATSAKLLEIGSLRPAASAPRVSPALLPLLFCSVIPDNHSLVPPNLAQPPQPAQFLSSMRTSAPT